MADVKLDLPFWDYDRTRALADGTVKIDNGLDNAEPRTAQNTTETSFHQWCEEALKPAVSS